MNLHIENLDEWARDPSAHKASQSFAKKVAENEEQAQKLHDLVEKRKETDAHRHSVA